MCRYLKFSVGTTLRNVKWNVLVPLSFQHSYSEMHVQHMIQEDTFSYKKIQSYAHLWYASWMLYLLGYKAAWYGQIFISPDPWFVLKCVGKAALVLYFYTPLHIEIFGTLLSTSILVSVLEAFNASVFPHFLLHITWNFMFFHMPAHCGFFIIIIFTMDTIMYKILQIWVW